MADLDIETPKKTKVGTYQLHERSGADPTAEATTILIEIRVREDGTGQMKNFTTNRKRDLTTFEVTDTINAWKTMAARRPNLHRVVEK